MWVKPGTRNMHMMLLSLDGFRENRRSEGRTCLMGMTAITFLRVP
jgi:hypothetical protein